MSASTLSRKCYSNFRAQMSRTSPWRRQGRMNKRGGLEVVTVYGKGDGTRAGCEVATGALLT
jgi:hypothetical protein